VGAPAAASGDAAELLDVHVHQLAGPGAFVAHRGGLGRADHFAGHRVQHRKVGQVVAGEDARDRAGGQAELSRDLVAAEPLGLSHRHHPFLDPGRGRGGAAARARTAVAQAGLALGGEPVQPLLDAPARDAHRRGDVGLFPALLATLDDQQPAAHGQAGISVRREDSRVVKTSDISTKPGGPPI
jgi:hypothetical protein